MKILIVNKFLHPNGGSETYIFKVGEQLQQMGHEVQYFGMEHEGRLVGNQAGSYTADMDFHTGKLRKLIYPLTVIYSASARRKLRPVLDQFQPDAVHLNNFNFQLTPSILYEIKKYAKASGRTIKIIYTAHDSQLVCPNHLMQNPITGERCSQCLESGSLCCVRNKCIHGSRAKSLIGAVEAILYKRLRTYDKIDTIICPSNFLKKKLDTDPVLRNKTMVMPNFVDQQQQEPTVKEDYVLYFGRYSAEKGITTLLKACAALPDIPFCFAGSGAYAEAIASGSNIKNMGFLSGKELFIAIAAARFSIFPSECYENCPFTVMESLICGTPVIGSALGGTPELLEEGVTGELFAGGNDKELAEKISALWADRERLERYTENCRSVEFDTVQEYCQKLILLYQTDNEDKNN